MMSTMNAMDTTGTALVFDEIGFTGVRCTADCESRSLVASTDYHAPPSVIMPRVPGEPPRLDCAIPLHPRGTGCCWPPEARADIKAGIGRFPLAAAWASLPSGQTWTWRPDDRVLEIAPSHAISVAVADVLRLHPRLTSDGKPTLVIPNTTRESEQQALLDEASQAGISLQLLWRPVASAMVWCEQNHDFLRELGRRRKIGPGSVVGRLVCLHLGLAQVETALLDVVLAEHGKQRWFLPARRRPDPDKDSFASSGWAFLKSQALTVLADAGLPLDDGQLWQILFASNWASARLAEYENGHQPAVEWIKLPSGTRVRATPLSSSRHAKVSCDRVELLGRCSFVQSGAGEMSSWFKGRTRTIGERIIGAVVTGEMASVAIETGLCLSSTLVSSLDLPKERILLSGSTNGRTLLARGAALFSARLAAGLPTYLDTLPRLQLLIRRDGEMIWEDLLEKSHAYVPGGRVWTRPEPVSDLAIPRSEPQLIFAVYHEEHPGVRELNVQLPRSCDREEPARLHVSMTPAHGNARLEVQPERPNLFGTSRILVDWKRMRPVLDEAGQSVNREEYINRQPRIYPELLPRLHSPARWRAVLREIEGFLAPNQLRRDAYLNRIIERLKQKDPTAYPRDATAVSSEGTVSHHQTVLDQFVAVLADQHRRSAAQLKVRITRCLGYTSTNHAEFADWLAHQLSHGDAGDALIACGQCFRKPIHVAILADRFSRAFSRQRIGNRLNWLKALSATLCYRSDATKEIASEHCLAIMEICLKQLNDQLNHGSGAYIFRYAALVIVFMLRRRAHDNGFLAPDSELAGRIKDTFRRAINAHRSGRFHVIGGAVDVPQALQQMIDYIDRRGMGSILLATADDGPSS